MLPLSFIHFGSNHCFDVSSWQSLSGGLQPNVHFSIRILYCTRRDTSSYVRGMGSMKGPPRLLVLWRLCANGPICVQEGKEREKGVECVLWNFFLKRRKGRLVESWRERNCSRRRDGEDVRASLYRGPRGPSLR